MASYSGDANNTAASSGCGAVPITVTQDAPSISTQLSATTVTIGATVHDAAALVGSSGTAGGTVTYSVYAGAGCTGLLATLGPVTVTNGIRSRLVRLDRNRSCANGLLRRLLLGRRRITPRP